MVLANGEPRCVRGLLLTQRGSLSRRLTKGE
jgi:hypothetical protein